MTNILKYDVVVVKLLEYVEAGLLKPSIFKGSVATIEKEFVIRKIGTLTDGDRKNLE